jgi:phospholipid transport system substrate-binding protein
MFAGGSTLRLLAGLLTLVATLNTALAKPVREPQEIVRQTADQVLEIINSRGKELENDPQKRAQLIDKIILPLIDFQAFSQLVLGYHWRTAAPEQRDRFVDAFQDTLVRTYTKSVSDYAGTRVSVLPARGEQDNEYRTVYTEIRTVQNRVPLSVIYSFRFDDGQWKAYDVTIDGLSLVKNFRSSFDDEINSNGLNALIARLEQGGEDLVPQGVPQ